MGLDGKFVGRNMVGNGGMFTFKVVEFLLVSVVYSGVYKYNSDIAWSNTIILTTADNRHQLELNLSHASTCHHFLPYMCALAVLSGS